MSVQTETFNKHPAQWIQITHPKAKHWNQNTGEKDPQKTERVGRRMGHTEDPGMKNASRLLTRNHMIMEQCLQNHERKFYLKKNNQDKLSVSVWIGEKYSCGMWSLNMFYLLDTLAEKANGGRVTPRRGRKLGKMIWNQRGEENRQDDGRGRSQGWQLNTSHG